MNDMWVNATYPSDGSTYKNEILKCSTSKAEGEEFDIADWKLASKYTDDTKAEEAKKAAEKAQEEIKNTQTNLITLGTTVSNNKKAFDVFTSDGYLDSSEIALSHRIASDWRTIIMQPLSRIIMLLALSSCWIRMVKKRPIKRIWFQLRLHSIAQK